MLSYVPMLLCGSKRTGEALSHDPEPDRLIAMNHKLSAQVYYSNNFKGKRSACSWRNGPGILLLPALLKHHDIAAEVLLLLLVHLYRFDHMEFGELGYISIADDVAVDLAPFFLAEDHHSFLPVVHTYFI